MLVSAIDFRYLGFVSASRWVPAMDRVYQVIRLFRRSSSKAENFYFQLVADANITSEDGSDGILNVSPFYANWSADKVRASYVH